MMLPADTDGTYRLYSGRKVNYSIVAEEVDASDERNFALGNGKNAATKGNRNASSARERKNEAKRALGGLRDGTPLLGGQKTPSKTILMRKAVEYIRLMRKKNSKNLRNIKSFTKEFSALDPEICGFDKDSPVAGIYVDDQVSVNSTTETSEISLSDSETDAKRPNGSDLSDCD